MSNYFKINRPSNLVVGVIASSFTPSDTKHIKFVMASDKALDAYYKWCELNPGRCPDVGELMMKSPYFKDQVCNGKVGIVTPINIRIREVKNSRSIGRETEVRTWIANNPNADIHDIDAALCTGAVAARAYLSKYNP